MDIHAWRNLFPQYHQYPQYPQYGVYPQYGMYPQQGVYPQQGFVYALQPFDSQAMWVCPGYGCRPSAGITASQVQLSNMIRLLWEQHVVWTRLVIVSMANSLPDVDLVTKRLLRNPVDFEQALRPLYGDRIAAAFRELLTSHLVIAAELVKAAKAGDNRAAADAERRWYENADQIAAFLASINPCWSQEEWRTMLHRHLALTKNEAVFILTGDYAAGIATFDEIEKQALQMADVMTRGIIRQFPERFH